MKEYIHVSKNGTRTPLRELNDVHLDNIIALIERSAQSATICENEYKELKKYHLYGAEKHRRDTLPV